MSPNLRAEQVIARRYSSNGNSQNWASAWVSLRIEGAAVRHTWFWGIACLLPGIVEAAECDRGRAAPERAGWEYLENNAFRAADDYVVSGGRPEATPSLGNIGVHYQMGGEFEGQYLLMLSADGPSGALFMVLKPNFDFCIDPQSVDDTRDDLFSVVSAKLNNQSF